MPSGDLKLISSVESEYLRLMPEAAVNNPRRPGKPNLRRKDSSIAHISIQTRPAALQKEPECWDWGPGTDAGEEPNPFPCYSHMVSGRLQRATPVPPCTSHAQRQCRILRNELITALNRVAVGGRPIPKKEIAGNSAAETIFKQWANRMEKRAKWECPCRCVVGRCCIGRGVAPKDHIKNTNTGVCAS